MEPRGFFASLEATAQIGNLYTGSLYLSLATGLVERVRAWGQATSGKKVLLASYGGGNTTAVMTARMAARAAVVVDRWNISGLIADYNDVPFKTYQAWIDTVATPANYPALLAASPPPVDRFALTGFRENGYREYRFMGLRK